MSLETTDDHPPFSAKNTTNSIDDDESTLYLAESPSVSSLSSPAKSSPIVIKDHDKEFLLVDITKAQNELRHSMQRVTRLKEDFNSQKQENLILLKYVDNLMATVYPSS
jgi:hypothetical protein